MIDPQIFKASREAARLKLPPDLARHSFGYYIDIPSSWDTCRSPEEMINYLGIHRTHAHQFTEIIEDLGPLSAEEKEWAKRYVAFYEKIARIFGTGGYRVDLKHDIAETLYDWRTILKFAKLPARILDFGAGCARQEVSAFLRNENNIYTAIDATIAAYTIQNMVLSNINSQEKDPLFHDFLDYETAGQPFPDINKAVPGNRFHIPTWLLEGKVPEKFFDIIIAAHVHNELSGPDFLRFIGAVDKGLGPDGIVYIRSEVTVIEPRDYFDTVDLHAIDLVDIMRQKGLVPIYSIYETFMTTVFAREGSAPHKAAMKSKAPEHSLMHTKISRELSIGAADHFMERNFQTVIHSGKKVALIGDGCSMYELYVKSKESSIPNKKIFREDKFLGEPDTATANEFASFIPDIIVIASQQYNAIQDQIKKYLPGANFPLKRYYWYPLVFLYSPANLKQDSFFNHSIFTPKDLVI